MKKIVLSGDHLTPALAFSDYLKSRQWQIAYLSAETQAQQLLPAEIVYQPIISPKLHRHNYPKSLLAIFKLPLGIVQAIRFLKNFNPCLVVSFGGHSALPVCLAAYFLNKPIIIHEQTFQAGLTSRISGHLAQIIALSWPQSLEFFPKNKTVLVGNLLRKEILLATKPTSTSALKTIYITGGHQGSRAINQAVAPLLPQLLKKYRLFHQFGLRQSTSSYKKQLKFLSALPAGLRSRYIVKPWFSVAKVAHILRVSDLVISRSGINTITELAFLRKAAILVPLPFAQKNEQLVNAGYLKKLGLATIILQKNLSSQRLLQAINNFQPQSNCQSTFPDKLIKQATANLYQQVLKITDEQKKN